MSSKKARPGLLILENVYSIALNPDFPYEEQLQSLASSGHLANKTLLNSVVIKLCEYIDKQAETLQKFDEIIKHIDLDKEEFSRAIKSVERKNLELSRRIGNIENSLKTTQSVDPTQPLPTAS